MTESPQSKRPRHVVEVDLVQTTGTPGGVQMVECTTVSRTNQMDLVDMARQIQTADEFVKANACSKLSIIAEQVRMLQEQAQRVLNEAQFNADLHHVACNFSKVPGTMYYLYRRSNVQRYFSLLSPNEWGSSCPHEYLGGFKLEHDMSWTPISSIAQRNNEREIIERILGSTQGRNTQALTDSVKISMNIGKDTYPEQITEMEN